MKYIQISIIFSHFANFQNPQTGLCKCFQSVIFSTLPTFKIHEHGPVDAFGLKISHKFRFPSFHTNSDFHLCCFYVVPIRSFFCSSFYAHHYEYNYPTSYLFNKTTYSHSRCCRLITRGGKKEKGKGGCHRERERGKKRILREGYFVFYFTKKI